MGHPQRHFLRKGIRKPLTGLTITPDDSEAERYGKTVSDLQSDVAIADGAITGTLAYVTGYTGFSGDASLQEGNYLSLKLADDDATAIEISIGERGPVDVKEDGFIVIRLTAEDLSEDLVIADKNGVDVSTTTLDISGLTLAEEAQPGEGG